MNDNSNSTANFLLNLIRDLLLLFPIIYLTITQLGFVLGYPISSTHLPIAFFITLLGIYQLNIKHNIANINYHLFIILTSIIVLLIFTGSIFISISLIDIFYDSRAYHTKAIMALADGWNPLHTVSVCDFNSIYCNDVEWILRHYPKAQWYLAAGIYKIFNNLDSTKAFNVLFVILTLIVAWQFFYRLLPTHPILALIHTLAIGITPVSIVQIFSNYIDGVLVSIFTIYVLFILSYFLFEERKWNYFNCLIMPYLINLKFTGLVYAGIFGALPLLIFFHKRSLFRHYLIVNLIAGMISVSLFGFNPYFTNALQFGHPLYPVVDKNGTMVDVTNTHEPNLLFFFEKNRFEKFYYSLFTIHDRLTNQWIQVAPFTKIKNVIIDVDTRFSGFGPLFSGIFLIALLHLFSLLFITTKSLQHIYKYRKEKNISAFLQISWFLLSLATIATIFITPTGWWARLSPQVWLAVCLIETSIVVSVTSNLLRISAIITTTLMVINTFLSGQIFKFQYDHSTKFFHDVAQVATEHKPIRIVVDSSNHFTLHNERKVKDLFGSKIVIHKQCTKIITGNPIFEICEQ